MTEPSLPKDAMKPALAELAKANELHARLFPGDPGTRQPVHVVYGGAQIFMADTARRLGERALEALEEHAPQPEALAGALGLEPELARTVYDRVTEKLEKEPVEDFRIDFEDGYGNRPDAEEDAEALRAAGELARGQAEGALPPFIGIRIKPLSGELHRRSLRTLDLFVSAAAAAGPLPEGFAVTLPKITDPRQVKVLVEALTRLEERHRLPAGSLKVELMIETPQSVLLPDGTAAPRRLALEAGGRCVGAHFGTYDYTALCEITAAEQRMDHPACDFAKHVMQVSLAGTGVRLSDGATNILPVGPHRAAPGGALTEVQRRENTEAVHRAWRLHYAQARRSLAGGFYQGWDLHPAQLPSRYAAVYAFFLKSLPEASARLKNFVEKAAQATLVGDVFDDAATGQGLLNYFLRSLNCGAITWNEARATGLAEEELRSRSFVRILEGRRQRAGARA